jgi:molecular chaperone Hsp33
MREQDKQHHFLIETCDVSGQLVQLDQTWLAARERTQYPPVVEQILGEAFVSAVLLAGMLKMEGKCTLQVRGDGPVHLLVVQVNSDGDCRGLARWSSEPTGADISTVFGKDATMSIAIESTEYAEPYQGIVPLEGDTLADAMAYYLSNSQQLQTQLTMTVDGDTACGLLLQKLPVDKNRVDAEDGWPRATHLASTVTDQELVELAPEELLKRLFFEEEVRLYDAHNIRFHCACSRERTGNMLIGIGQDEVSSILEEQGEVSITCEFCDENYRYDAVDVAGLFKGADDEPGDQLLH